MTYPEGKIFNIGLSKTGTTSLTKALQVLGYKTKHYPSVRYIPHMLLHIKSNQLKNYDAFTDIPVIPFYKSLDSQFPGSKFIYTIRDKEDWLHSCKLYPRFNWPVYKLPFKVIKLRNRIYGTAKFDKELFSAAYDQHHEDVMNYFRTRRQDLLIMDVTRGDGWNKLCAFLNKKEPDLRFPFKNSRKNNYDNQFSVTHSNQNA